MTGPNPEITPPHSKPAQGRSASRRWLARTWRWRIEVRPVPIATAVAAWTAAAAWLTPDRTRSVQAVLGIVLEIVLIGFAVLLATICRQRRRRIRKEEPRA